MRLEAISKRFERVVAVDRLSVAIPKGSFVCLLGPSGCGKTTTLRMIAGFTEPDEGTISINGQDVSRRPPNKRDMGMVYQSYALFPHMTVLDNVGFGLRMRGVAKAAIFERASRALALVGLAGMEGRRPRQLSGGQQQRVALADTVVIMNEGRAEQIGSPREVYANPKSSFVADFLGKVNIVKGAIDKYDIESGTALFVSNTGESFTVRGGQELTAGAPAEIFIRPERIRLRRSGVFPQENGLQAVVERAIFTGAIITLEVVTATGLRVLVDRQSGGPEEDLRSGDGVEIEFPSDAIRLIKTQTTVVE